MVVMIKILAETRDGVDKKGLCVTSDVERLLVASKRGSPKDKMKVR